MKMKTATIDADQRIRLPEPPGQKFWVIAQERGYLLERVLQPQPVGVMTKQAVLQALSRSRLDFSQTWDELRAQTREP
jgi:hypothetical protein